MILIRKGKEPKILAEYRQQQCPKPTYEDMPKEVRSVVLDSLMEEQGYLCAYCMSRIPQSNKNPSVSIEHWDPQSATSDGQALDYRNMFAVCNGSRSGSGEKNCDASRGNKPLTVHPLKPETLSTIRYRSNGEIYSDIDNIKKDLCKTLNLNSKDSGLVENRRRALQQMLTEIRNKYPTGDITNYCTKTLQMYSTRSPKQPYVGILIDWLKRHTK